jgi:hypothetical protein
MDGLNLTTEARTFWDQVGPLEPDPILVHTEFQR